MNLAAFLGGKPTPRFVWSSLLVVWIAHVTAWWVATVVRDVSFESVLLHYDAGWYAGIALRGYSGSGWAFYPLWPAFVAVVSRVVPLSVPWLQPILAGLVTLVAVRLFFTDQRLVAPLAPRTRGGWLTFLFVPAGYVLHSGHTEALFVLLAMAAFARAATGAWVSAAVLAGLSALTKNQGTFVALAVGLWAFRTAPQGERVLRFVVSGVVSGALFALYPLYQYLMTGDPFLAQKSQGDWTSAGGAGDVIQTLLLGNSKDPWEYLTRARHPWFIGFLIASGVYLKSTRDYALSVYFFGCILAMLLQGTVSNLFRYTLILVPLFFFVGDALAKKSPRAGLLLLLASLYFHAELTWNYGVRRWPY